VRVKCLAQEHHIMSPARAQAQTAQSGVLQRTIHEPTLSSLIVQGMITETHNSYFCWLLLDSRLASAACFLASNSSRLRT